ncbi:MAG: aldo/keto reductase [Desulfovibrio sp.]|jgi:predicted aldo/keto reductase-like oxidoreductase|nr:aldo/keto reductase [Desulfovibrio sp.]
MEKMRLGRSGLSVSRQAFGALPLQRCSLEDAVTVLHAAVDGGIDFFDTARMYSDSEHKLGIAFKGIRHKLFIATKTKGTNKAEIEEHVAKSLAELRTDYLDLYQFHNAVDVPRPGDGTERYEAFAALKKSGAIRCIGLTSHSLKVALEAAGSGLFDTIQFPMSLLATVEELQLVEKCREADVGLIAMKALAGGLIVNIPAAYAFLRSLETVLPIWGVQSREELADFLRLEAEPPAYDERMKAAVRAEQEALGGRFCRGCGYCLPCPQEIFIPFIARLDRLLRRSPWQQYAEADWVEKMRAAKSCIQCGACAERCPYKLDTPELIADNVRDYENFMREHGWNIVLD